MSGTIPTTDSLVLTGPVFQQPKSGDLWVTPTGGALTRLADALGIPSFSSLTVGVPPNNRFTVHPGATSSDPISLLQSGTGGFTIGSGGTISGFGYGIGQALGPLTSVAGIPAISPATELIFQRTPNSALDGQDFLFRRATAFSGGTLSNINKTVEVATGIGSGDGCMSWGFLSVMSNGSTVNGEAVSAYLQTLKTTVGSGQCWAFVSEMTDTTGQASATAGAVTNNEMDISAFGADNGANPDRWPAMAGVGVRQMTHYVFGQPNASTPSEYTMGLWFGTQINGGIGAYVDSLLGVQHDTQIRHFIDTRGAIPPTGVSDPVYAVVMSAGHIIDFDGPATLTGSPQRYLTYSGGRLSYFVGATKVFSIDDSGNVRATGTITGSTTP